jgi:hypothetical protein
MFCVCIFKYLPLSQLVYLYSYIYFQASIFSRLIMYPDIRKENLLQNIASEGPTASFVLKMEVK